jgi:hypothetical protein
VSGLRRIFCGKVSIEGGAADPEVLGDRFGGMTIGSHAPCRRDVLRVADLAGPSESYCGRTADHNSTKPRPGFPARACHLRRRESGWRDSNPRPLRPERSALPSCATPRVKPRQRIAPAMPEAKRLPPGPRGVAAVNQRRVSRSTARRSRYSDSSISPLA